MEKSLSGWIIGDRLKCVSLGKTLSSPFKCDRTMEKGEIGEVTSVSGPYTELLLSDGKFVTRYELPPNCMSLVKAFPIFYEIY